MCLAQSAQWDVLGFVGEEQGEGRGQPHLLSGPQKLMEFGGGGAELGCHRAPCGCLASLEVKSVLPTAASPWGSLEPPTGILGLMIQDKQQLEYVLELVTAPPATSPGKKQHPCLIQNLVLRW